MPYKKVGAVKNATIHAALNAEVSSSEVHVIVYATSEYPNAELVIEQDGAKIFSEHIALSPVEVYDRKIPIGSEHLEELTFKVRSDGRTLVHYTPQRPGTAATASPSEAAREPAQINTNEELLLTAQHIEQHRHATYLPDPYYERACVVTRTTFALTMHMACCCCGAVSSAQPKNTSARRYAA